MNRVLVVVEKNIKNATEDKYALKDKRQTCQRSGVERIHKATLDRFYTKKSES